MYLKSTNRAYKGVNLHMSHSGFWSHSSPFQSHSTGIQSIPLDSSPIPPDSSHSNRNRWGTAKYCGVPLQVKRQSPHSKKETIKAYHRLIYVFAHAILVSIDGHPSKYSFLLTDGDKRHAEQLKNLLEHDVSGNGGNVDDENDESGEGDSDNEDSETENEKSKNNEGQGGEDEDGEDENNEGKSSKSGAEDSDSDDGDEDNPMQFSHLTTYAFRAALERLISEAVAELDSLCLDSDFRLTISNLVPDNWRNDDRGYSWVHNADFGSHRLAFLTEIFSNPSNKLLEVDASGKLDIHLDLHSILKKLSNSKSMSMATRIILSRDLCSPFSPLKQCASSRYETLRSVVVLDHSPKKPRALNGEPKKGDREVIDDEVAELGADWCCRNFDLMGTGADTRAGLRGHGFPAGTRKTPKSQVLMTPIKPARVSVPTGHLQTRTCKHGIPYPWPRVQVLAGTGAGRQKIARGLPVPITKNMYYSKCPHC
ncbi:hypothetical protein BDZ97DRAFT_2063348 [Flammula alnicola]|nr:hypothetical protein BDZ97DRAFT_2063348 [Flammula alnicola]